MDINKLLKIYQSESIDVMSNMPLYSVEGFVKEVVSCYISDHKIFAISNGGGAAFVDNLVTDLNLHPFVSEDKSVPLKVTKRLRCFNLCSSPATITGILNDLGGDEIFSKQLEIYGDPKDLVIGISGSGNSKNILSAFKYAKENGMRTVLMTRNSVGHCHNYSDIVICINGTSQFPGQTGGNNNNFHFEDMVSKISHMCTGVLCQVVKNDQP